MSENKVELINRIFSPSSPIKEPDFFSGRLDQISKIKNAISEVGQHVILYGKRGSGKTSLSNILSFTFPDYYVIKVNCSRTDNFYSIWDKVLRKVSFFIEKKEIGYNKNTKEETITLSLPEKEYIDADDLTEILQSISADFLIIFDEFDSITDNTTKTMMADTIKALSDNVENVTLLITGIGENIKQLLGYHPSIERCIKQIKLDAFSKEELSKIIDLRLELTGLQMDDNLKNLTIEYSSEYAHYVHLISKYAFLNAVNNKREVIDISDFNYSIEKCIEDTDYSLKHAYEIAVKSSGKKHKFTNVMYACATGDFIEKNNFNIKEVVSQYNRLNKSSLTEESVRYNLGMLCRPERGEILEKLHKTKPPIYTFKNPLMKAYIKLQLHVKNK